MISYSFAIHLPLLQGEAPTVAALRQESSGRLVVVRIGEPQERHFHTGVMSYVATLAEEIATIDSSASILARLVFSGLAFGPGELAQLLDGRWPEESYATVAVGQGAGRARLDAVSDGLGQGLPLNRFHVPRAGIIAALNLAYNQPGKLVVALRPSDAAKLREQMASFAERANRIPANDPEAVMEYPGEGMVMALGVGVWHAFSAAAAMRQWQSERLGG